MVPQIMISKIGCTLNRYEAMKVPVNSRILMVNCDVDSLGLLKFSGFMSNKADAANSPTTAGRNPLKTDSTVGCF